MKKLAAFTMAAGLFAGSAYGKVSFSLDIEALTQGDGASAISDSGLLVLMVDKSGTGNFALPTEGSIENGDTEIVTFWDLSEHDFTTADLTLTAGGVPFDSDWSAGDPLALYWFPSLSATNMVPTSTTEFGVFADSLNVASGDSWLMPADGTLLHSLKFFTEAATKLVMFGDFPSAMGVAAFSPTNLPGDVTEVGNIASNTSGGTMTISWDVADAPAGGFVVQRQKKGSTSWETVGFADSSANSFQDTDFKPGQMYSYRVLSQEGFNQVFSAASAFFEAARSIFINLAARGSIVPGSDNRDWTLMNAGIVMRGNDPFKRVMALGIGPYNRDRLNQPWLADTRMEYEIVNVVDGKAVAEKIATNDDWMRDEDGTAPNPDVELLDTVMATRGTPVLPTEDAGTANAGKDSAIVESIANIASGTSNIFKVFSVSPDADPGFVGIQVYDAEFEGGDNPVIHDNRIVNLSTKGYLAEGATAVFNGSMVIAGAVPKEVLVLARGPALALKGVQGTLENPVLILKRGEDVLTTNDDWDSQTAASNEARGLLKVETDITRIRQAITLAGQNPDDHTLDSALLVTLQPGSEGYIFKVEAAAGSTTTHGTVQLQVNEMEFE